MTVREREMVRHGDPAGSLTPVLVGILWAVTALVAALTTAGFAARLGWAADLAGAFRHHYAILGVVCLAGMAMARRWAGVLIAAGLVAANAAVVAPLWLDAPAPVAVPAAAPTLTVLWHNVNAVSRQGASDLVDAIIAADADVVVLAQVKPRLSRDLRRSPKLPHDAIYHDDERRTLVLARVPVDHAGPVSPLPAGSRNAVVALEAEAAPGQTVAILGMHTLSPRSPRRAAVRDAELAVAASWAAARDRPAVIVGDLNTPPWSPQFRALLQAGGLRDSLRGRGLQPTWPAAMGPAGVPIDHALHSPDLAVVERSTGPAVGSLHRSVRVTVTPAAPAATPRGGSARPGAASPGAQSAEALSRPSAAKRSSMRDRNEAIWSRRTPALGE